MVYTHTRAIYNGLIREFLAAMPRICENCGAASPSIVRDGFLKLFEVPIKSKSKQFATNAMPTKSALDFLTVSQLAKMEGVDSFLHGGADAPRRRWRRRRRPRWRTTPRPR